MSDSIQMTSFSTHGYRKEARGIARIAKNILQARRITSFDKRLVIFGPARSGSTLLVTLLNAHPDIRMLNEILHDPVLAPVSFVERELYHPVLTEPNRGFKLLDEHLRGQLPSGKVAAMRDWMAREDVTVIHLHRENYLRQALSSFYARARDAWHSDTAGAARPTTISVDPDELIGWMDKIADWRDWRARFLADMPRIELIYETDLYTEEEQQATMERLTETLGLEPAPVSSMLRPVTPRSFDSFVENWSDVEARVRASDYRDFISAER